MTLCLSVCLSATSRCSTKTAKRRITRAALTGKHDTLVRRAPGWQGAPDGQQAKKLVVTSEVFDPVAFPLQIPH